MQIVIEIPNSIYANLSKIVNGSNASKRIIDCVKNGTPLPKGHGRLIDADELLTLFRDGTEGYDCATYTRYEIGEILEKEAPTIIEGSES